MNVVYKKPSTMPSSKMSLFFISFDRILIQKIPYLVPNFNYTFSAIATENLNRNAPMNHLLQKLYTIVVNLACKLTIVFAARTIDKIEKFYRDFVVSSKY